MIRSGFKIGNLNDPEKQYGVDQAGNQQGGHEMVAACINGTEDEIPFAEESRRRRYANH